MKKDNDNIAIEKIDRDTDMATLTVNGNTITLPIVTGTEGEKAIDISSLRKQTGFITLDPGLVNTASCTSAITFIDGEKGILKYRGYRIEELVNKVRFVDVAYLLVHGTMPSKEDSRNFSEMLNMASLLHEDLRRFLDGFPRNAHPMHILGVLVNAMSIFYPEVDTKSQWANIDQSCARVISIVRTMAAFSYKKSIGEPLVYPQCDLSYCANFLNMMFNSPVRPYHIDPEDVRLVNDLFIIHADHEQNCSTTTVRAIGSAQANLYSTISAGVSALSGPLHGGANQAAIKMLKDIYNDGGDVEKFMNLVKRKEAKLMGFGHRVYKTYDPRAVIARKECEKRWNRLKKADPLFDIAQRLEEAALNDPYFMDRNLYPNMDFYTGLLYRSLRIPENMFTVMFAIARLPGWVAHWREMIGNDVKLVRPRQIYTGPTSHENSHSKKNPYPVFIN